MYGHARIQACTGMYAPGAPAETAVRCLTGHGGQGGDDGGGAGGQRVGGVDRGRRGDGNEEIGGPDGDVAEVTYGGEVSCPRRHPSEVAPNPAARRSRLMRLMD